MEVKLTEKQRKWAESYVKHFNATKACEEAGYSGNRNVLGQQGFDNLKNPKIQAFMREALGYSKEAETKRSIATIEEVMEFYSKGMRGEIKDQFGLDATMSDRIKCANSLDKILQMSEKNKANEDKDDLIINQCYGKDDDDG